MPETSYNWCRSLFHQFASNGVRHVAISPGSRSTSLSIAADSTEGLETSIHLDERAGGYFALGLAKATSKPVILICTSGTAAANYHPAVVEAFYSGIPLIIISADRPPELQNRGAPQTIDQIELYGKHVRGFFQTPVPSDSTQNSAISLATDAFKQSLKPFPGPVHINCPLREPLEPSDIPFSTFKADDHLEITQEVDISGLKKFLEYEKGLIVVGPMDTDSSTRRKISELGNVTGWPVVADPASSMRNGPHVENCVLISSGEHIFRSTWVKEHKPDVIVQMGRMPTSKGYKLFLNEVGCQNIICTDHLGFFPDPENVATHKIAISPNRLAEGLTRLAGKKNQTDWTESWNNAEKISSRTIRELINNSVFDEAATALCLEEALPEESCIFVSNSMPIRDLDAFLPSSSKPLKVFANRGANGIDGVISTTAGISKGLPEVPTILFTGDLAFLHDLSGFTALRRLGSNLTIVVVDNNGGGIFSFLPIAETEGIDFLKLFHTPHDLDIKTIASVIDAKVFKPTNYQDFSEALKHALDIGGVNVIHLIVDTETNVTTHKTATNEVNEALK
jgi:2-succinyl-5-enolpyruvyl-6-hydroxy-3-cyclohexene-1-carboxylate synthase